MHPAKRRTITRTRAATLALLGGLLTVACSAQEELRSRRLDGANKSSAISQSRGEVSGPEACPPKSQHTFQRDIVPLLTAKCLTCHANGMSHSGGVIFDVGITTEGSLKLTASEQDAIVQAVISGNMPPDAPLDTKERRIVAGWKASGFPVVPPFEAACRADLPKDHSPTDSIPPPVIDPEGEITFDRVIKPIMEAYCASCHGPTRTIADLDFTYLDEDDSTRTIADPAKKWIDALLAIQKRTMPPFGDQVPDDAVLALQKWIKIRYPNQLGDEAPPQGEDLAAYRKIDLSNVAQPNFEQHIKPLMKGYCASCHGATANPWGNLRLDRFVDELSSRSVLSRWRAARQKVAIGAMPPKDFPRPSATQWAAFDRWIEQGLRRTADAAAFDPTSCDASESGIEAPRVLGNKDMTDLVDRIFGAGEGIGGSFGSLPSASSTAVFSGFNESLGSGRIGAIFDASATIAESVASRVVSTNYATTPWSVPYLPECTPADIQIRNLGEFAAGSRIVTCATLMIDRVGRGLYGRPLTNDERETFLQSYRDGITTYGTLNPSDTGASRERWGRGTYQFIRTIMNSPHFLLRVALGQTGSPDSFELSDEELADKLAMTLWGGPPDAELLALARDPARPLRNPTLYDAEVDRLMGHSRFRMRVYRFFDELLSLDKFFNPNDHQGNPYASYDDLYRDILVETYTFLDRHMFNGFTGPSHPRLGTVSGQSFSGARDGRLADLLTSRFSFYQRHSALTAIYQSNVPIPAGQSWHFKVPTELPPERPGILTRAVSLAANADRPNLVRRGQFVLNRLLCENSHLPGFEARQILSIKDEIIPPAADPTKSGREIWETLTQSDPTCNSCHQKMNAIGFTLEAYDTHGRHRALERLVQGAGVVDKPIETEVSLHIDGELRSVANLPELMQVLAASDEVNECFAQRWLEFATSRGMQGGDQCAIAQLAQKQRQSGILPMIKSHVTSATFKMRRTK